MATLGRKSMRKTLKSLRKDALREIGQVLQERSWIRQIIDRADQLIAKVTKRTQEIEEGKIESWKEVIAELLDLLDKSLKSQRMALTFSSRFIQAQSTLLIC